MDPSSQHSWDRRKASLFSKQESKWGHNVLFRHRFTNKSRTLNNSTQHGSTEAVDTLGDDLANMGVSSRSRSREPSMGLLDADDHLPPLRSPHNNEQGEETNNPLALKLTRTQSATSSSLSNGGESILEPPLVQTSQTDKVCHNPTPIMDSSQQIQPEQHPMRLHFLDEQVEDQFLTFRYKGPAASLPVLVGVALFNGVCMLFSTALSPRSSFTHTDRLFGEHSSWSNDDNILVFHRYWMTFLAIMAFLIALVALMLRLKRYVLSGRQLEGLHSAVLLTTLLVIVDIDALRRILCGDEGSGVGAKFLRSETNAARSGYASCPDHIDPVVLSIFTTLFLIPVRVTKMGSFTAVCITLLFPVRVALKGASTATIFYRSDAVWIVMAITLIVMCVPIEKNLRLHFIKQVQLREDLRDNAKAKEALHDLLSAMFPTHVLDRLEVGQPVEDSGVATVLFSDLAAFTQWCSNQDPLHVVEMLNILYMAFDEGLVRYNVEKIKTIGDAYVAASGLLPASNVDQHVLNVCSFTMHMQRSLKDLYILEEKLFVGIKMRIGVHTGPVHAGIVGEIRGAYDVFGLTTEVAQCLEASAAPQTVVMSEATHHLMQKFASAGDIFMDARAILERVEVPSITLVGGTPYTVQSYLLVNLVELDRLMSGTETPRDHQPVEGSPSTAAKSPPLHSLFDEEELVAMILSESFASTSVTKAGESLPNVDLSTSNAIFGAIDALNASEIQASTAQMQLPWEAQDEELNNDAHHQHMALVIKDSKRDDDHQAKQSNQFSMDSAVLLLFDHFTTEVEFERFFLNHFVKRLAISSSMCLVLCLVLFVVSLTESISIPQPDHVYPVLLGSALLHTAIVCVTTTAKPIVQTKAVYYANTIMYVQFAVLLLTLLWAHPHSILAIDLTYLSSVFTFFAAAAGYTGISYIYATSLMLLLIILPTIVLQLHFNMLYPIHVLVFIIDVLVLVLSLYRDEKNMRQLFKTERKSAMTLSQLREKQCRGERLLAKMMPCFVIDQLSRWFQGGRTDFLATSYMNVGVLFVRAPSQFTRVSESTQLLIKRLNQFAKITERMIGECPACTKLKMIGDVTMVVSNMTTFDGMHSGSEDLRRAGSDEDRDAFTALVQLAELMLRIDRAVKRFTKMAPSAGIHCGPCTAGIIGTDRLFYDVFGDTVNTTSRVMSNGGVGTWASSHFKFVVERGYQQQEGAAETPINVPSQQRVAFTTRLTKDVKGKGSMDLWQVEYSDRGSTHAQPIDVPDLVGGSGIVGHPPLAGPEMAPPPPLLSSTSTAVVDFGLSSATRRRHQDEDEMSDSAADVMAFPSED